MATGRLNGKTMFLDKKQRLLEMQNFYFYVVDNFYQQEIFIYPQPIEKIERVYKVALGMNHLICANFKSVRYGF